MPETYSEMDVHVYYLACGAHVKKKISMLFSEGQDLQNFRTFFVTWSRVIAGEE